MNTSTHVYATKYVSTVKSSNPRKAALQIIEHIRPHTPIIGSGAGYFAPLASTDTRTPPLRCATSFAYSGGGPRKLAAQRSATNRAQRTTSEPGAPPHDVVCAS